MFNLITSLLAPKRTSIYGSTLTDVNEDLARRVPASIARQYRFLLRELTTVDGKHTLFVAVREGQTEVDRNTLSGLIGEIGFRKSILGTAFEGALELIYESYPSTQIDSYLKQIFGSAEQMQVAHVKTGKSPLTRETADTYRLLITGIQGEEIQAIYCDNQGLSFLNMTFAREPFRRSLCKAYGLGESRLSTLRFHAQRVSEAEFRQLFQTHYPETPGTVDDGAYRRKAQTAQARIAPYLDEDVEAETVVGETAIDEILNAIFLPAYKKDVQDVKLRYDHAKKAITIEYILDDVQIFPPPYPGGPQLFSMLVNRIALRSRIDDLVTLNVRRGEIHFTYEENGRRQTFSGRVLMLPRNNPDAPVDERQRGFFVTVRLIRPEGKRRNITQLGLYPEESASFLFARRQKSGLILICGQTGTGKQETIMANLDALRDENGGAIRGITLERPIEGRLDGYDQIAVPGDVVKINGVETARDGAYYLSGAMQASPRVIYINEINDGPTAKLAIVAEQTGNLLWSTVHSKDPFSAIDRLRGLDLTPDFIAGSLLMVTHQVLAPKICERCKTPDLHWRERVRTSYHAPSLVYFEEALRHWFSTADNPTPTDRDIDQVFRPFYGSGVLSDGSPCPNCRRKTDQGSISTGFSGRALIPEIWIPGPQQSQISEGVPNGILRRTAIRRGHNTLWFNAIRRIADGLISIDSAAEACDAIDLHKEGIGDFDLSDPERAAPVIRATPRIHRVTIKTPEPISSSSEARQLPRSEEDDLPI